MMIIRAPQDHAEVGNNFTVSGTDSPGRGRSDTSVTAVLQNTQTGATVATASGSVTEGQFSAAFSGAPNGTWALKVTGDQTGSSAGITVTVQPPQNP